MCSLQLTDSDGKEFASMPYYAGSGLEFFPEEDQYEMTAAYQKIDMDQELYVRIYNFEEAKGYGPYAIKSSELR